MAIIFPNRYSALSLLNRKLQSAAFQGAKFFILLDENSYQHCLPRLITQVPALEEAEFLEVPVGEEAKSIEIATQLWGVLLQSMAEQGLGRNDLVLVNLGGGCVSDIGGFVAAGLKRGVRYINIPTTLIGMVDASIGGKTAVNLADAKNQIGFFHQPELTVIEPAFIDSLPASELTNGLFEILKVLSLANPEQYEALCAAILRQEVTLSEALIKECVLIKESIVRKDPKDHGIRKMLNFGHTFGHAIEVHSSLPHGEAVGIGMACAFYLSVKKLGLDTAVLDNYLRVLRSLTSLPHYTLQDTEAILTSMRKDKKNDNGLILCVLMQSLGAPVIDVAVDDNEIRDTLLSLHKL